MQDNLIPGVGRDSVSEAAAGSTSRPTPLRRSWPARSSNYAARWASGMFCSSTSRPCWARAGLPRPRTTAPHRSVSGCSQPRSFFVPYGLVINELSSRFPVEGGLYVWAKEAFGDFHGFVAGWNYWIYTFFYFPGTAARQRIDERLHHRIGRRRTRAEPHVFARRFVCAADRRGWTQHHRAQHREMAAKRRRRRAPTCRC